MHNISIEIADQNFRLGPRKWIQKSSKFRTTKNSAYLSQNTQTRKAQTQVYFYE